MVVIGLYKYDYEIALKAHANGDLSSSPRKSKKELDRVLSTRENFFYSVKNSGTDYYVPKEYVEGRNESEYP